LVIARALDLPVGVARGGDVCRGHGTPWRTARMGRRFPAPVTEDDVTHTDDEKALDRRRFLKCMAWVGTGAVWTMSSGVLNGSPLGQTHRGGGLRFVQISEHHIRFAQAGENRHTAR